jgi:hypothetical protein
LPTDAPITTTDVPTGMPTADPITLPPTQGVAPTMSPIMETNPPTSMSMDLEDMDEILNSADDFGRSGKKFSSSNSSSSKKTRMGLSKVSESEYYIMVLCVSIDTS